MYNMFDILTFQAAYLISHPHGYSRFSSKAKWSVTFATFVAVFLNLPITVCQFFFLKPSDILKKHGSFEDIVSSGTYYNYNEQEVLCYRWFFEKTVDYHVIVYFIHTCNILAVILVVLSYCIIIHTVLGMRWKQRGQPPSNTDQETRRVERERKQNRKIALMSLLTTTCVLAPWLLSLIVSLLMEIVGYENISNSIGQDVATKILRSSMFIYYVVTWIFPIMAIMTNSALSRATRDVLINITKIDMTVVANSVARFNNNGNNNPRSQANV